MPENTRISAILGLFRPAPLTYLVNGYEQLGGVDLLEDPRVLLVPSITSDADGLRVLTWQELQAWTIELREHALRRNLELAVLARDYARAVFEDPAYLYMLRVCDNALHVLTPDTAEVLKVRRLHHTDMLNIVRRPECNFDPWVAHGDVLRF